MNRQLPRILSLAAVALVAAVSSAAAYRSDANTGPNASTIDTRLFVSASGSVPAPVNRLIWFVADLNLDGVPTAPTAGNILGPDDFLIRQDTLKGSLLVGQPGQYQRAGIEVSDTWSNANIVVYLWNVATNTPVGLAGQTFGVANLGVVPVPAYGNADWVISSPIYADQVTVLDSPTTVPEPSVLLLLLAGVTVVHLAGGRLGGGQNDGT